MHILLPRLLTWPLVVHEWINWLIESWLVDVLIVVRIHVLFILHERIHTSAHSATHATTHTATHTATHSTHLGSSKLISLHLIHPHSHSTWHSRIELSASIHATHATAHAPHGRNIGLILCLLILIIVHRHASHDIVKSINRIVLLRCWSSLLLLGRWLLLSHSHTHVHLLSSHHWVTSHWISTHAPKHSRIVTHLWLLVLLSC